MLYLAIRDDPSTLSMSDFRDLLSYDVLMEPMQLSQPLGSTLAPSSPTNYDNETLFESFDDVRTNLAESPANDMLADQSQFLQLHTHLEDELQHLPLEVFALTHDPQTRRRGRLRLVPSSRN